MHLVQPSENYLSVATIIVFAESARIWHGVATRLALAVTNRFGHVSMSLLPDRAVMPWPRLPGCPLSSRLDKSEKDRVTN